MSARKLTYGEMIGIVRDQHGNEKADEIQALVPADKTLDDLCEMELRGPVQFCCNRCQAIHTSDHDIADWKPGIVWLRPDGWVTWAAPGQGFADGMCDICDDCMCEMHWLVYATGRNGEVDLDRVERWYERMKEAAC